MATNVERPLEWMRFEPVKFGHLVDELPRAQIGTVMKLILRIWEFGPLTEATVRTLANEDFESVRSRMFEVDGLLSFEMIEEARTYGKRSQLQRVKAGQSSAAKRNDRSTTAQRPMNDRSTDVLSVSVSNSTSTISEKERAKPKPEPRAPAPELFAAFHGEAFNEAWSAFEAMRQAKRKPMTAQARKLIMADLAKMGEADAIRALNNSTRAGWTDVYPPKATNHTPTEKAQATIMARDQRPEPIRSMLNPTTPKENAG